MEFNKENTTLKTIPNDVDKEQKGINVPNLRFNEEKWISVKNHQLFFIASEKNKNNLVINVLSASQEKGMIPRNEIGIDISFDKNSISNYKIVNIGDYVVHLRSFQGGFAFSKQEGICSPAYTILRPNLKYLSNSFFESYFTSQKFINSLKLVTYGIRDGRSIAVDEWLNMSTYIPSREIQDKIINFIENLNLRINTQSKIIEDLETLKNKINDTLIYQQGYNRTIPLYELSTLKNGYAFKSSSYTENADFKIITIGNVTGAKFCDTKECNKIQYIPKDIQSHQKLKKNDILISLTGNVGRVSLCNEDNCLLNQRVGILELHSDVNREFIYQCLSNKKFEQAMICKGQGAAQLNIGKSDIESFDIPLFDKKYQEYVSSVLSFYDTKIQKEKDMLELYKKQKAYLLQNMFI